MVIFVIFAAIVAGWVMGYATKSDEKESYRKAVERYKTDNYRGIHFGQLIKGYERIIIEKVSDEDEILTTIINKGDLEL